MYRSINLYIRPVINYLGLAYGLADIPFTFILYSIYTFLFTLKSSLIDTIYIIKYTNNTLKLSSSPSSKVRRLKKAYKLYLEVTKIYSKVFISDILRIIPNSPLI